MKHILFLSIGILLFLGGCSSQGYNQYQGIIKTTTNLEDVNISYIDIEKTNPEGFTPDDIIFLGNTGSNKYLYSEIRLKSNKGIEHRLILGSKPGYSVASEIVPIKPMKTSLVSLTLERDSNYSESKQPILEQEGLKYGYIKLTSNESTVDVYIDGELKGQIPGNDKPFNKKITTGEHTIMVKKQFFSPNSIKVNISENEIIPYHFELVKATGGNELTATQSNIYQTKGNLTILTERNDLTVYIDGAKKVSPTLLTDIPAGFYTIKVEGPNIDDTFKVTVKDKETTIINLDEKYK